MSGFPEPYARDAALSGRAMLVKRADVIPVECVARGYLSGSGWKQYRDEQAVCGVPLPPGLVDGSRLPAPIFTPATKAAVGDHDENISYATAERMVGAEVAAKVRDISLALYATAFGGYAATFVPAGTSLMPLLECT